jgi:hypothetical protein
VLSVTLTSHLLQGRAKLAVARFITLFVVLIALKQAVGWLLVPGVGTVAPRVGVKVYARLYAQGFATMIATAKRAGVGKPTVRGLRLAPPQ